MQSISCWRLCHTFVYVSSFILLVALLTVFLYTYFLNSCIMTSAWIDTNCDHPEVWTADWSWHHGACSVAASYKPPMLVTRVRLPACASFFVTSSLTTNKIEWSSSAPKAKVVFILRNWETCTTTAAGDRMLINDMGEHEGATPMIACRNTHRGARTHDHKVKGLALCRLS